MTGNETNHRYALILPADLPEHLDNILSLEWEHFEGIDDHQVRQNDKHRRMCKVR